MTETSVNITPRFSVVIASYNYGSFLPFALDSALGQTYQDFEVIVIDDGSTDTTPEVIKPYLADSRVRYIRQENAGQAKTKNRGVAESRGELIAFLDADDIWCPEKLEKQLRLFGDPGVGVVYSRRTWVDPQGQPLPGNERVLRRGNILDYIFIDNFVCFSSSVVRRSLLLEVGCFDENISMGNDYDLWVRLAARCKFDFVDEPLVNYRTGHANLSKNVWRRFECAQKIMRKSLQNPDIKNKLSRHVPDLAWADTWTNMAEYARKQGDRLKSGCYLLKALKNKPTHLPAWKGLIKSVMLFD